MNARLLLTALAALCPLLLPSCVRWSLGENVLTTAECFVGWDYRHPVDGQIYCSTQKDGTRRYYAQLEEVRYHVMPHIVMWDYFGDPKYEPCGETPTGQRSWAELLVNAAARNPLPPRGDGSTQHPTLRGCTLIPALPADARPLPPEHYSNTAPARKRWEAQLDFSRHEPETAPGDLRCAVATGLSYSVDPLLSFTSTTAFTVGELAAAVVAGPFIYLYALATEGTEPEMETASPVPHASPQASTP